MELAEFRGVELVPELVDEGKVGDRNSVLLSDDLLDRIAKAYHHSGFDVRRVPEVFAHGFLLNACVHARDYSIVPGGELHLLDSAASIDKVEPDFWIGQDYYCEVGARDPRSACTIFRQFLYQFLALDENESPVLFVHAGLSCPSCL